jgi:uncharacterized protein
MPMPDLPPDLSRLSLAEIATMAASGKLPPVEQWNPPHCGQIDIRIARDGSWFHQGGRITRETVVRLFSSILRREADGTYVLVTPAEKLSITVKDVPFVAVEVKSEGEGQDRRLAFRLNTGDLILAGPDHPIRVRARDGIPAPYVGVRGGMEALITRAAYYDLAHIAVDEGAAPLGVWSNGSFFPLDPAACA